MVAQVIRLTDRSIALASSFGVDETTLGPPFRSNALLTSERYRLLDRRSSYYSCTHHDWKQYDFDARSIPVGNPLLGQPLMASEPANWYVPLRWRRPSAPYRLARVIVDSFTNLILGYQRWPTIRCAEDSETEAFVRALVDATRLRTVLIRARSICGSAGTVGISWGITRGTPRVQVHHPRTLYVHRWADRERLIPAHVTEIYKFPRDEWDVEKKLFLRNWYWFRRDWTETSDVAFHEVRADLAAEPSWVVDEELSYKHDDGFAHFVWWPNLPSDTDDIDGVPDYEGLYENFEALDLLNSTLVRGTTLNLDPTLILKLDPEIVARTGVKKGSDNSLVVGQSGDAHYMELQGTSVQVGTSLFTKMREAALEVAQCVVPDPNQIGAAGTSSVALKVIYAPMLGKADVLRGQAEQALHDLLMQMVTSARKAMDAVPLVVVKEDGSEEESVPSLNLPPRIVTEDVLDPDTGEPTGERRETVVELKPGRGETLRFDWGDYFLPTAQDQQQTAATLTQLVAGTLLSQESGADLASRIVRIDPRADWDRIASEKKAKDAAQAAMMGGDMGGAVDAMGELPPGASEGEAPAEGEAVPAAAAPEQTTPAVGDSIGNFTLGVSDLASIVTVNEGRATSGLGALLTPAGQIDPDGYLTIAEFGAKRKADADARAKIAVDDAKAGNEAAAAGPDAAGAPPVNQYGTPDGQPPFTG